MMFLPQGTVPHTGTNFDTYLNRFRAGVDMADELLPTHCSIYDCHITMYHHGDVYTKMTITLRGEEDSYRHYSKEFKQMCVEAVLHGEGSVDPLL